MRSAVSMTTRASSPSRFSRSIALRGPDIEMAPHHRVLITDGCGDARATEHVLLDLRHVATTRSGFKLSTQLLGDRPAARTADTRLTVSLWTTGKKQNAVPVDRRLTTTVAVTASAEPQWVEVPLAWHPESPEAVVVIVEANPAVAPHRRTVRVAGVLALANAPQRDEDANVEVDESEHVIARPAIPLRGSTLRVRTSPSTDVYSPAKAVGGYARPYGGPQMWVLEPTDLGDPEWLLLSWDAPTTVSEVHFVFDDDVDIELNTLHHHRTPELVFPELVRDYVVGARTGSGWEPVVTIADNRKRHRVHTFEAVTTDALRVRVLATNGVPQARVVSWRVY